MYPVLRPFLFRLDPERAHALTITLLRIAGSLPPTRALLRRVYAPPSSAPVRAFDLTFANPIGLAAGYDKDALAWRGLACLGFGHVEVGTVTLNPQPGNPKPRLFRLPQDQALINRLGFPGRGAAFVVKRLAAGRPPGLVLGINIGKGKDTPLEHAHNDYTQLLQVFAPLTDYLVINVSSPNTLGLRRLQSRAYLETLLTKITASRSAAVEKLGKLLPLLVKLSPDLSDPDLADALAIIRATGIDGAIVANTTTTRPRLTSPLAAQTGGLSGRPLARMSTTMVEKVARLTQGELPIVAAGGVLSPQDAQQKLDTGAVLIQLYTGLVYRGPSLVKEIISELSPNSTHLR